jgi:hypothetical protein
MKGIISTNIGKLSLSILISLVVILTGVVSYKIGFIILILSLIFPLYMIGRGLTNPIIYGIIGIYENRVINFKMKGHFSNNWLYKKMKTVFDLDNRIDYWVNFPSENPDVSSFKQVNKLFGISLDRHHHVNSVRWGFSEAKTGIEIFEYIYLNNERIYKPVLKIKRGRWYNFSIHVLDKKTTFTIKNSDNEVIYNETIKFQNSTKPHYYLFPYFGGKNTPPSPYTIKFAKWRKLIK